MSTEAIAYLTVVKTEKNPLTPWIITNITQCTGSGVLTEVPTVGRGIITNAHVVSNCCETDGKEVVIVDLTEPSCQIKCRVLVISHPNDLAFLTPIGQEGENILNNRPIIRTTFEPDKDKIFGLNTNVNIIGFPSGDKSVCINNGIISRLTCQLYAHVKSYGPVYQTNASIVPGNSGGAALTEDNHFVGIPFEGVANLAGTNYIIPNNIIGQFNDSVQNAMKNENKLTCRKNVLAEIDPGFITQTTEGDDLRQSLGISGKEFQNQNGHKLGLLVNQISNLIKDSTDLKEGDVILKVDGNEILSDGSIEKDGFKQNLASFFSMVKKNHPNVKLYAYRNNEGYKEIYHKCRGELRLSAKHNFDRKNQYIISNGALWVTLTMPYLETFVKSGNAPKIEELRIMSDPLKSEEGEEQVILARFLDPTLEQDYGKYKNSIIKSVDNRRVKNLYELYCMLNESGNNSSRHRINFSNKKFISLPKTSKEDLMNRLITTTSLPENPYSLDRLTLPCGNEDCNQNEAAFNFDVDKKVKNSPGPLHSVLVCKSCNKDVAYVFSNRKEKSNYYPIVMMENNYNLTNPRYYSGMIIRNESCISPDLDKMNLDLITYY